MNHLATSTAAIALTASIGNAAFWEVAPRESAFFTWTQMDGSIDPPVPMMDSFHITSRLTKLGHDITHGIYNPNAPQIPLVQFEMAGGLPGSFRWVRHSEDFNIVAFDDGSLWFPGTFRFDSVRVGLSYYNDAIPSSTYLHIFGDAMPDGTTAADLPDYQINWDFSNFYVTKEGGFGRAQFDGTSISVHPEGNPASLPNFAEYVAAHVPSAPTASLAAIAGFLAAQRRR